MTFLELVNDVLLRLRQDTVSTLTGASDYTKLVMKAVNDAVANVENAWDWTTLRTETAINTVAGTYKYSLTGSGAAPRVLEVWNSSGRSLPGIDDRYARVNRLKRGEGSPQYYYINGVDSNQDAYISFFPTPGSADTISVYAAARSPRMTSDTDVIKVPVLPVMLFAHAYLARERGEDQGTSVAEFLGEAQRALGDAIALDAGNYPSDNVWWTP